MYVRHNIFNTILCSVLFTIYRVKNNKEILLKYTLFMLCSSYFHNLIPNSHIDFLKKVFFIFTKLLLQKSFLTHVV